MYAVTSHKRDHSAPKFQVLSGSTARRRWSISHDQRGGAALVRTKPTEARRLAIYWVGGWGRSFVGLWEKPQNEIQKQHFAFEVDLENLTPAIASLVDQGIQTRHFFGEPTTVPSVFGWVTAASVYFDDPDGHILELIAMLPGVPKPEVGTVSLPEWERMKSSDSLER